MIKNIRLFALFILTTLIVACAKQPSFEEMATWDYGPYPEQYEEIVKNYMSRSLFDPYSAQYIFNGSPSKNYLMRPFGETLYGWHGTVSVNAKNRFGGYVGYHTFDYIIRYGTIIYFEEKYNIN